MNIEDMQREGKIELRVVLGVLHINGMAVQIGKSYLEPRDLIEDTELVIDLETANAS